MVKKRCRPRVFSGAEDAGERKALITVFVGAQQSYSSDLKQLFSAPTFDRLRGILMKY